MVVSENSQDHKVTQKPLLTRTHSTPTKIGYSLTADQYIDYAMNLVKICIKNFNPVKYRDKGPPDSNKYLIFFDAFENDWERVRDKIMKESGINFSCVLITYEYGKCTDAINTEKSSFLSQLTRIRRIIDLCYFRDANISEIFKYAINRPSHLSHKEVTRVVDHAIRDNKMPSLIQTIAEYRPEIFGHDTYRYACGHSISGAYVLRLWQLGLFDQVYVFSPSVYSIPILKSHLDLETESKRNHDIYKGIEMGLVHISVGNEKKDSFVRIPLIENRLKCIACKICGHMEITNCPHVKLFDEPVIPEQIKGPRNKRPK